MSQAGATSSTASSTTSDDDSILKGATRDELGDLNNWYDYNDISARRDQANAYKNSELTGLAYKGNPDYVQKFEQKLPAVEAQIAGLQNGERESYFGQLAVLKTAYENAENAQSRTTVEQQFGKFQQAVLERHTTVESDPLLHTESLFNQPYGFGILSAEDQKLVGKFEDARDQYHAAQTPEEREDIVSEISAVRAQLQNKIGDAINQAYQASQKRWQGAQADVDAALSAAKDLQGEQLHDRTRLEYFGSHIFKDELHARAFTDAYQRSPDKFKDLRAWENELREEDKNAAQAESHRTVPGPTLPPYTGFTDVPGNLPPSDSTYGENLLAQYQYAQRRIVAAERRIAVQGDPGGPLYQQYLKAYAPPKPDWQQQLDEAVGRFIVGMVPGVNLFTDYIVPRSNLPDYARTLIDVSAGAAGGVLLGAFGEAGLGLPAAMDPLNSATGALGSMLKSLRARIPEGVASWARFLAPFVRTGAIDPALSRVERPLGGTMSAIDRYALERPLVDTGKSGIRDIGQAMNGQKFVSIEGHDYAVRWDKDNGTWQVYDKDNGWRPGVAIRQNAKGEWEINSDTGLPGGAPPDRLTPEKKQEIADYYRNHPEEHRDSIARRFNIPTGTLGKIARDYRVNRQVMTWPSSEQRAQILADIKEGKNNQTIMRERSVPRSWVTEVRKQAGPEFRSSRSNLLPDERQRVIDSLRENPNATDISIAKATGVSDKSVGRIARQAGIERARSFFVTAQERQNIIQYHREHPEATPQSIAKHFRRSDSTISRILRAEGAAAPGLGATQADVESRITDALRADPNATYEQVAQAQHVDPDVVRNLAELRGLERGGLAAESMSPQAAPSGFGMDDPPVQIGTDPLPGGSSSAAGPVVAYGSQQQQAIAETLRAHPDWDYGQIAREVHADPLDVQNYAEQHGLDRGSVRAGAAAAGGIDSPVATGTDDFSFPPTVDVDQAMAQFEPLTEAQKREINQYGGSTDAKSLAQRLNKPEWMIERYMQTSQYATNRVPALTASQKSTIDELFPDQADSEQLSALLGVPEDVIFSYIFGGF